MKLNNKTTIILAVVGIAVFTTLFSGNAVFAQDENFVPIGEGEDPKFAVPNPGRGEGPTQSEDFGEFVTRLIDLALLSIGSVAVVFLMLGGFWYVTSWGREEQLEQAKKIVQYSVIGLVITFLAFVIVRIIVATLATGNLGL